MGTYKSELLPLYSVKLERYEVAERVTRPSKNHDGKKALKDANECIPSWS